MMKKLITGEEIYHGDFGEFSIGVDNGKSRIRLGTENLLILKLRLLKF